MVSLLEMLKQISKNKNNEINSNDDLLIKALDHLDKYTGDLGTLKGKKQGDLDFKTYVKPLLDLEAKSKEKAAVAKENYKSWRVVIDMPTEQGHYLDVPTIQICSGEPSYHRLIMVFKENRIIEITVDTDCVQEQPNLSAIYSMSIDLDKKSNLDSVKKFYDEAAIQRIAILGSARVFAHPKFKNPQNPSEGHVELSDNNKWAQTYNKRVERELNKFLDVMEESGTNYLTINGGWAGLKEESTGLPLISSLFGAISDYNHGYSLPPITVMPKAGAFDRVTTRGDVYNPSKDQWTKPTDHSHTAAHTYFEVNGVWGDDSKYLVGFSTGMLVFEPYGFWTNIELANGVAQKKPVAVIADPENFNPGKIHNGKIKNNSPFYEVSIQLPEGQKGPYRVYKDAGEATKWILEQSMALIKTFCVIEKEIVSFEPNERESAATLINKFSPIFSQPKNKAIQEDESAHQVIQVTSVRETLL